MAVTTASGLAKRSRTVRFTASGTWVAPPGVRWITAECVGGGGGITFGAVSVAGSASSVAAVSATVTAAGNIASGATLSAGTDGAFGSDAPANSGYGGGHVRTRASANIWGDNYNEPSVAKGHISVTEGESVTVTIGAGGNGTSADGGAGYARISWEV